MHPNGQIPAYEFAFSDVNPPVHAWAHAGASTRLTRTAWACANVIFLDARLPEAAAQFHLVGESQGSRRATTSSPAASSASTTSASSTARSRCPAAVSSSRPTAPRGWRFTAPRCSRWRSSWRQTNPAYEDIASKFFEHFVAIADAMNHFGGHRAVGRRGRILLRSDPYQRPHIPLKVRSMVGIIALVRGGSPRGRRRSGGCPASSSG